MKFLSVFPEVKLQNFVALSIYQDGIAHNFLHVHDN